MTTPRFPSVLSENTRGHSKKETEEKPSPTLGIREELIKLKIRESPTRVVQITGGGRQPTSTEKSGIVILRDASSEEGTGIPGAQGAPPSTKFVHQTPLLLVIPELIMTQKEPRNE